MMAGLGLGKKGSLLCISGPSGVGKGTVIEALKEAHPDIWISISATTREPRGQEQHGVEYYFLSHDEFLKEQAAGEILEYDEYCGHYYGTPRKAIEEQLLKGRDVMLDVTIAGALEIKEKMPQAIIVFLLPPSLAELQRRLRGRKTEREDQLIRRLERSCLEIEKADKFDYLVVNRTIENAVREIEVILEAESLRPSRNLEMLENILQEKHDFSFKEEQEC